MSGSVVLCRRFSTRTVAGDGAVSVGSVSVYFPPLIMSKRVRRGHVLVRRADRDVTASVVHYLVKETGEHRRVHLDVNGYRKPL